MKTRQQPQASGTMRLFYALWPDDAVRASFMRLQTVFKGRHTAYANLHLTLAFLGQQPAHLLPTLQTILSQLPGKSIPLVIDRAGYFRKQRIAWAGMHAAPDALQDLQSALTASLQRHGIAFDAHPTFKPHVTLARNGAPPEDQPFEPIHWRACQVALVRSSNGAEGVRYQLLASRLLDDGESEI